MTANTTLNLATVAGGDVIATDDIGPGVKYQRVKLTLGNTGVNDGDLSKTNPIPIYLPPRTVTNISGTITTGGAAQVLSAANATGRHFSIQNLHSVDSLWFSDIGIAAGSQPSIQLMPGAYYESPYSTTAAISIIGATTAQAYSAREWS